MGTDIVYIFNLLRLILALIQTVGRPLLVLQFAIHTLLLLFLILFGCLEFYFSVVDICDEVACGLFIVVMCPYHLLRTNQFRTGPVSGLGHLRGFILFSV